MSSLRNVLQTGTECLIVRRTSERKKCLRCRSGRQTGRVSGFPSRFAASQPVEKDLWYKAPVTPEDNLHGDLRGIIEHLDHVQNLGIDVLYMTPVFKSNSSHKYDTIDYYQIDPSFGTTEDLRELVQEAHKRGMKIVMDAVFNHTGREFFCI